MSNPIDRVLANGAAGLYRWIVDNSNHPPTNIVGNDPLTGNPPAQSGLPGVVSIPITGTFDPGAGGLQWTGIASKLEALLQQNNEQGTPPIESEGPIGPGDFGDPAEGAGDTGGGGGIDGTGESGGGTEEKLA